MPGAFIQNDLSAVFNTADFAHAATVDGLHTVNGIFENQSQEVATDDERMVMVVEASFVCPSNSPIVPGSTIVIDGISYVAKTPDQDGTGVTTWMMKRVR